MAWSVIELLKSSEFSSKMFLSFSELKTWHETAKGFQEYSRAVPSPKSTHWTITGRIQENKIAFVKVSVAFFKKT